MKVTKRNILELIMASVCLVFLFVPGPFIEEYWKWDKGASTSIFGVNFHGVMSLDRETEISFLDAMLDTNTFLMILGLLVFAVLIGTIILMVRQLIAKGEQRNSLPAALGSVVSLVLYVAFTVVLYLTVQTYINYELAYNLNWMYYIHIVLFVAFTSVSVIGYIQAKKHGVKEDVTAPESTTMPVQSVADELLKYKELKDAGAITEEEFLAIKKKLL